MGLTEKRAVIRNSKMRAGVLLQVPQQYFLIVQPYCSVFDRTKFVLVKLHNHDRHVNSMRTLFFYAADCFAQSFSMRNVINR